MSSISWRHDGKRLVIPVAVLAPFESLMIQFERGRALIDTGATKSAITRGMIRKLDLSSDGKRP